MNVKLLAHTRLTADFIRTLSNSLLGLEWKDGQAVALTAIRTCYSPHKPSEIVSTEGEKYFRQSASDSEGGTEADRLIRYIVASKHTSTLEHLTYTFAIEGISRALLAQLTRHRIGFSFSVQSQRYVRFGSGDKSGGLDYVIPPSLDGKDTDSRRMRGFDEEKCESVFTPVTAVDEFEDAMTELQGVYDRLRRAGVPAEDARMVLPNAAASNLVMTVNLRALLDFYTKRKRGNGSQWEIADLAERLRQEAVMADPWTAKFFE